LLVDTTIEWLENQKANIRCEDLVTALKDLGFTFKSKKTPNHKVFTHSGLADFYTSSFNCPHGGNKPVKLAYVVSVLRILRTYREPLTEYLNQLGEHNDD
jgi:hypothetical protein